MLLTHKPFIIVISSPSGAGKTTIAKAILQMDSNIDMSVSVTTRPKRDNEIEGKDYKFIDNQTFDKMLKAGKFLESATVFDYSYGSPTSNLEDAFSKNRDLLFDVDWQGANQLKSKLGEDIITIYILPPSMTELEKRLKTRSSDSDEVIRRRMIGAKNEISHWHEYDFIVVNNNIDETVDIVHSIIKVTRLNRLNISKLTKELLNYA
jgi:guanylate kinase